MNKHSFWTRRNITFIYGLILASELVGWISEHCPSHSSRTMTTERSQVHAMQSKHNTTVGGNSRCLSVWACHTQKLRLLEPSSVPQGAPAPECGWDWNDSTSREPHGGGVVLEIDGDQLKNFREKFILIKTLKKEKQTIGKKKDWETREEMIWVHRMTPSWLRNVVWLKF